MQAICGMRSGTCCSSTCRLPKLRHIFADRVYRGDKLRNAIADVGRWTIEIVTRSERSGSFKPEPKRWVVERTVSLRRGPPCLVLKCGEDIGV
jgi:transposase